MENKARTIKRRLAQLKTQRTPHEPAWRGVLEYSYPSRLDGFNSDVRDAANTANALAKLTDSTLAESAQILVSNIMSGMTPPNAVWVGFETESESQEESLWFEEAAEIIWRNIHASNFDSEGFESALDMVLCGWGVEFIDVDRDRGGYVFEWLPISSCYVAQSRKGGPVDTLYRPYKLTAEQAVRQFSMRGDAVSSKVRDAADKRPDDLFEFCHAIYPRPIGKAGVTAKMMAYASCHIETETETLCRESGYHEQPFTCFRWSGLPNSPYGIGPSSIALPDARSLNEIKRLELANLDMAVGGMWIAEDDGVLNPRTVKVGARKIIVANSVDSMKSLQPATDFNVAVMSEERLEQKIKRVMMADHLTPRTSGPVETAAAVYERIALIRQLMGPLYGRMQSERLRVMVERCFGLALRAGALPPMPESLQGKVAHVTYRSPFARSQKLEEVAAIERAYMLAGQIAQAKQDPSVFDNLNDDESITTAVKALGADRVMVERKDVLQIRAQRAKAQQAQQMQAMIAPAIQEAGKGAGKAIGEQVAAA